MDVIARFVSRTLTQILQVFKRSKPNQDNDNNRNRDGNNRGDRRGKDKLEDRIYTGFQLRRDQFPRRLLLVNNFNLLHDITIKAVNHYNSLFNNFQFFKQVVLNPEDVCPTNNYDGGKNASLGKKYNVHVVLSYVSNDHVHGGSFEKHYPGADVLAHATLPNGGDFQEICIDSANGREFEADHNYLYKVLLHEMGHIVGLLDLGMPAFEHEPGRKNTIMDSYNFDRVSEGLNNIFDKKSFKYLYSWLQNTNFD